MRPADSHRVCTGTSAEKTRTAHEQLVDPGGGRMRARCVLSAGKFEEKGSFPLRLEGL